MKHKIDFQIENHEELSIILESLMLSNYIINFSDSNKHEIIYEKLIGRATELLNPYPHDNPAHTGTSIEISNDYFQKTQNFIELYHQVAFFEILASQYARFKCPAADNDKDALSKQADLDRLYLVEFIVNGLKNVEIKPDLDALNAKKK